jgi:hypothetical protein
MTEISNEPRAPVTVLGLGAMGSADGVAAGHGDKDIGSLVQLLAQDRTEPVASEG